MTLQRHTSLLLALLGLLCPTSAVHAADERLYYHIYLNYKVTETTGQSHTKEYFFLIHKDTTLGTFNTFLEKRKLIAKQNVQRVFCVQTSKKAHILDFPNTNTLQGDERNKPFKNLITEKLQAQATNALHTKKDIVNLALFASENDGNAVLDKGFLNRDTIVTCKAFVQTHRSLVNKNILTTKDKQILNNIPQKIPPPWILFIFLALGGAYGAKVLLSTSEDDAENPTSPHAKTKKPHNPHPHNDDKDPTPPTHKDNA